MMISPISGGSTTIRQGALQGHALRRHDLDVSSLGLITHQTILDGTPCQ